MKTKERGFEFVIPRFYDRPRLYLRSPNAWLLVTAAEQILFDTVTGRGLQTRGAPPSGAPDLVSEETVVITRGRGGDRWIGLRRFVPLQVLGVLSFLEESLDVAPRVTQAFHRAVDLNMCDSWDSQRGHGAMAGDGAAEAVPALVAGLDEADPALRFRGASGLLWLFRHRASRCRCFSQASLIALDGALGMLFAALSRERDPEIASIIRKAWEEGY